MIQRARRVNYAADLLDRILPTANDPAAKERQVGEEESLEVLLKHAFRPVPADTGGAQVWQRLTRMMRGPFGVAALEGPAQSALEEELVSSGGWSNPVPFCNRSDGNRLHLPLVKGRESVWNILRFDQLGLPQRGCNV